MTDMHGQNGMRLLAQPIWFCIVYPRLLAQPHATRFHEDHM
ncbi:hypothetical protein LTSEMON_3459 [Salmonella enterica subsp. enterica serovar Montevideo str. S5-403]|uniref:Uncharacterized protein n=1 Tax=Salmonella enterica subsp. enterica serovar Montevideo str. S5-403 TaxID=913242 RepID=G5Q5L3_SALMO|nr:hypothetical protein LTSEMON_3459 [Salmonella enterica subsp. enterica serovar Montevideo str. S5-403]